jgi:centrosomal protein CEP104
MPKKLHFQIVSSSSSDDLHPASELNHHGPLINGWQSNRFCSYPQELVLQFENYAKIKRVQILSHQYLIGKKFI